jgi:hypothetical protein
MVVDQVQSKIYHYSVRAIARRVTYTIVKRALLFNMYKWLFVQSGFNVKFLLLILLVL